MDNLWLNDLLVNNGDNCLVNMVVNMLASDSGSSRLGSPGRLDNFGVLEMGQICLYSLSCLMLIVMTELAVLGRKDVVNMLLRQNLLVLERLNGGMVMVLMNFTVDSLSSFFVSHRLDHLADDGGVDGLFDGGDMTAVASQFIDCCSCCVHDGRLGGF
jgi:hypothetical protein